MANLKLTELATGNSVYINENTIFRVTEYNGGANSLVVYESPSAFLGNQKSVIVVETLFYIAEAATKLYPFTNNGVTYELLNVLNTIGYNNQGGATYINYRDVAGITILSTTAIPFVFLDFYINQTNKEFLSYEGLGYVYTTNANLSSYEIKAGTILADVNLGSITLQLPDTSTMFADLGLVNGSVIKFYVEIALLASANTVTLGLGAGMLFNFNMGAQPGVADLGGTNFASYEIYFKDSTTSYLSQLT